MGKRGERNEVRCNRRESAVSGGKPVYNYFYDVSFSLANIVTLITPARFLFNAGQTPKVWNDKMLSDTHFKVIKYFEDSKEVFPSVEIKGGVVIAYRDARIDFGPINTFVQYPELFLVL